MARAKLDVSKCKVKTGKSYIEYDLQLLAQDENVLANISVYKESNMNDTQRKAILKKLKLALNELVANGI